MSQPDTNPTMEKLRVLNLEDDENDGERIRAELETGWKDVELMRVDTRETFVRALEEFKPDVILSDFQLPGFDSRSVLNIVRQTHPDIPVIVITGALTDSEAVKLVKMGARDYVTKDRLQYLVSAVQGALSIERGIHARKAAEQALRQSEADIRALVEHSPIAMLVDAGVGADEKIVMMNRKFTELFGYTLKDIPDAQHWWPLAYPDDTHREKIKAEWTRRVEKTFQSHGSIEPMEASVTCKDGSIRYIRGSFTSIGDKNILGFEDLTGRKQMEDALKEAYDRNRAIMETANDAIIGIRPDGLIQLWNNKAEELFGYTAAEAIGHELHQLIVPERYRAKALEGLRQFAKTGTGYVVGKTLELTAWHKNRVEFPIELSISPMHIRGEWHATGIIRDITERKQAEESFRVSQARFSTIFNQASFGIALIDSLTGRIQEANPRFAEIAGRTIEEMGTIDWMSITHPDDVQKDMDNMALLNAGKIPGFNMDKRYIRPDGSIAWINMTIAPLKGEQAISPRHLCMIDDITERRQAEARIQKLTRLYATLSQTNQAIVRSTTSREELFLNICNAAVTHGNFIMAWVGLVDETTRTVKPVCHYGAENGYLTNIDISINDVPSGRGPTGTAIRDNRVSYVNDYAADRRTAP